MTQKWQFWIDRGGTFTDVVAKNPYGEFLSKKLLSVDPEAYDDAALHAIRCFLKVAKNAPIPTEQIRHIKMGTTVATNALLERKGEPTVLAITAGLQDSIEIGHQARPDTFALEIKKPSMLYQQVIAVDERLYADGRVHIPLNTHTLRAELQYAYKQGYRSIAIALMHAYQHPKHEQQVAQIAAEIGFKQISTSHEVSPLRKIIPRAETTIVDAYLTPILQRYVQSIAKAVGSENEMGKLLFMQSSGGLTDASQFRGRDAILSGPAGGIIGATHTARLADIDKIIGFDMGGTSTDVSHFAGEYEKAYETQVAGVNMRVPMLHIHTVAAGGGSLLSFDGERFRVGPESAGAHPGPVCYRKGGKLAVTDINVCLGKIQPDYFPAIFGTSQDQPLDPEASRSAFTRIAQQMNDGRKVEQIAQGFLDIAIEHMAQAIKKISIARGYDVTNYSLQCFGGAGGQHACLVADRLGIQRIFIHPFSGVLSAYGMGLAQISCENQKVIDCNLDPKHLRELDKSYHQLEKNNQQQLSEQGLEHRHIEHQKWALLRYHKTETTLKIALSDIDNMVAEFEQKHLALYGFIAKDKAIVIDTILVHSFGGAERPAEKKSNQKATQAPISKDSKPMFTTGKWRQTPVYHVDDLLYGHSIVGPAIIVEPTGTIIVEQHWRAELNAYRHIILHKEKNAVNKRTQNTAKDPVTLEIFNNLFMSIAEQMGLVLRNTSQSVNIKERLDFSCAIFDVQGDLVANAPHVPVHLGSMDSSVKVLMQSKHNIHPGDVFVQNNPYNGGSHLPDITVITPVFDEASQAIIAYVASRAHHEDIGGIAPGSMSPLANNIHEEGVIIDVVKLVSKGVFLHDDINNILSSAPYPARNAAQNIADLSAQIAANNTGVNEIHKMVAQYQLQVVHAYMRHIQNNAEQAVAAIIPKLHDSEFCYEVDSGAKIQVRITVDKLAKTACIDFTGTSMQLSSNFNAPAAITRAAVLYVFRCLVNDTIPLNAGCMRPIQLIIPKGCMLNPEYPSAVVAGNVETSQAVTNALFGALGALGSSQGTMNNLTFGNEKVQYYETICSGAPAGPGFNGTSAVHTHMTNTRLTDPEVLENRYPVMLTEFSIRRGSGGKGQWNAGDGVLRSIRFLDAMQCAILSDHRRVPLFGSQGGLIGELGRNWLQHANGIITELDGCSQISVRYNDILHISTPTGGGFGSPTKK